ncbi:putative O-methyltransferase [Xylariaceae sp. FL0662B]|nr:putative O-methyltransferase [Xylariaceae sp. FL0662B]
MVPIATNSSDATTLIEKLNSLSLKLSTGDENARKEAYQLSKRLTTSLDKPENAAVDLAFAPIITAAAKIAVELGLFKCIVDHGDSATSKELSSLSGGEELLIVRVLRLLASIGFVEEIGERTWKATAVTKAMATEYIAAGHRMLGETVMVAAQKGPKYLREAGYSCPTEQHDGFMQYAFQTKLSTFEFFSSMPQVLNDFNLFMGNTMGARQYWLDWFPVEERLLNGVTFTKDSILLVDVGGGRGHDVVAFHEKFPNQEGRIILQDRASVMDNIQGLNAAIELVTYDFFTEQPVKGARAYFFHHILHDWSDQTCMKILEQVKRAMKPGYSKLLLHEMIVPEQGASTFNAMLDMTMMAFNSGMERTGKQWEDLLQQAGFMDVKIWPPLDEGADGIVEAILRE